MKRTAPKPRNLLARDLWKSGAFKPRVVPDKSKALPRKAKHKKTEREDAP